MTDRRLRVRQLCRAGALAVGLLTTATGLGACSDDSKSSLDGAGSTTTANVGPATSVAGQAVTSTVAPTVTSVGEPAQPQTEPPAPTVAPTVPVDANAALQAALAALAPGYHFNTTITIDGVAVLTADGDKVGDGTRLGVVRDNVVVQYIITPAGTWVQPDGGEWDVLDTPAATTDPVGALALPLGVTVDSVVDATTRLTVSVNPSGLGLVGTDPVNVSVTLASGAMQTVTYSTAVDGKPATVTATFSAVVDDTPVVPPI